MKRLALSLTVALGACPPALEPGELPSCEGERLFGAPNESTGLGDDACGPGACTCGGKAFTPRQWTQAELSALASLRLAEPFAEVLADPWLDAGVPRAPPEGAVCGVLREGDGSYTLRTFASAQAAWAVGAEPTHSGPCGVCSTLTDLAVYAGKPDLTAPVRSCGLDFYFGPQEDHVDCLLRLGFSLPCAQLWYWNTVHTRERCGAVCLAALNDDYNLPDGGLNACLQCDEDESGPVFKAVAGRTRRNTGTPSSMCRPCSETLPFAHDYSQR